MVAQQASLQQIPSAVQDGSAKLVGAFNPQQMLRVTFALRSPHMQDEEEFVRQLQDPQSPQFHRYLSDEEWNARFSPSVEDEQAVVAWAKSQGFTITQRFSNRLLVNAEAPVATIQSAFNISINAYQLNGQSYFSNDRDPAIPGSLANVVQYVFGLNNVDVMRRASGKLPQHSYPIYSAGPAYVLGRNLRLDGDRAKLAAASKKKPGEFTSFGAYDPADLYSSYGYNFLPLQNLGHCCNPLNNPNNSPPESSIAIAIWGDYSDSDVQTWAGTYGLALNVQRILLGGAQRCNGQNCDGEATADTEYTTAMANSFGTSTNTAAIYVYEGPSADFGSLVTVLNQILSDGKVKVVNMSWGAIERVFAQRGLLDSYHSIFTNMVGHGITPVASSGDGGSTGDCQSVAVLYPASDPNVTAVGGTALNTSQSGYTSEVGWTGGPGGCYTNDGGSGGGCSTNFNTPSYQHNVCHGDYRSIPDVALNADGWYQPQNLFYQGQWYAVGGTSISSPEFAGFFAQENAYLLYLGSLIGHTCGPNLNAACAPLGAANPYLYSEGINHSAPHYPFYDITHGCNSNDITEQNHLTYYCAGPGYDQVTGWGSANMFQLAWAINYALAADGLGPSVSITGPPVNQWYNTNLLINWTMTDRTANGRQPNGVAGSSVAWDVDPGDPSSEPTPGAGTSFYGLTNYGSSGSASNPLQGCHTAYVRGWDNAGNSSRSSYGPLCFDNIQPYTQITLSGNQQQDGNYIGPVHVVLAAFDNASGVAGTFYYVDQGASQNYSGPFNVYLPGSHCLYAWSVDVAGNQEGYEQSCFNIASNTQFTLSVTKSGTGSGTVSSADGGILCGSTCSASYWDGQPVTLTAAPSNGSNFTGWQNCDISFGFSCTVTVTQAQSVTAVFSIPVALQFVPLPPCRVVDTRLPNGPYGGPTIAAGTSRDFAVPSGPCPNIPSNATAYSMNITTVPHGYLGYLSAWPTGFTRPQTSILNSFDGRIKANAAILPAGTSSSVSVFVSNTADAILDINGYFITPNSSSMAFFPLAPCRVVDTRGPNGPLGGPALAKNQTRDFPILQATQCNIPSSAVAYSFNVTAVPSNNQPLSYLTVWPSGIAKPVVSTLNAPTGTVTANAAIVPAGTGGDIDVYPAGTNSDLVIDIDGYFALSASGSNPLALYTFSPCRVLDTRQSGGAFDGQIVVNVAASPCEVPVAAHAYDLNATVVPQGVLGYLTLWPDGGTQPVVSTLNALDGAVTSNMAIVPTNNGSIDAYGAGLTQLLLDISSYFAP